MSEKTHKSPWGLKIWCALVAVWLGAPGFIIIPLGFTDAQSFRFPPEGWSLRWYRRFFTEPAWVDALANSIQVALIVMVVATVIGSAAAYSLSRSRLRGQGIISAAILAPMIVPGIVTAVAVLGVFLRWRLNGTLFGFVVAHTVLALPFVFVAVTASLRTFNRDLERAATSLGSGPWSTFRLVTLPMILPGVLSGAVFAFVTSLDEVVIALYLQTPDLRTLPVQMFNSVTIDVDPTIAAGSTLILLVTTMLVLLPQVLRRSDKRG
ncbi:ABC transporter permease [Georgenia yuyongxinii]|uniref:ABC transporter permease n=1 Tax=Georgenia yuyongxinii TaxID=2589797 RepID=A0A5B8C894_9MICO|nr:ABC transporter permease [Georgenia yuyongxinii]QDC25681.1 ABC transporter permease [Georgenia yuyongxinii]